MFRLDFKILDFRFVHKKTILSNQFRLMKFSIIYESILMTHEFIQSFLLKAKGPIIMVFSSSVIKFCFFGISLRPTIDEDLLIRNRSSVGFGFPEIIFV